MNASFHLYLIPAKRAGKFACEEEECCQTAVFSFEQHGKEGAEGPVRQHLCRAHSVQACGEFVGEDEG